MTSLLEPGSKLMLRTKFHNRLGWELFVEKRLYTLWLVARDTKIVDSKNNIRKLGSWPHTPTIGTHSPPMVV